MSRAIALAVLLLAATAAVMPAPAPDGPRVLVLGDSYASGEGLPDAEGACGTEGAASWGALVAAELAASDLQLLACSGAVVADLTVGGPLGRPAQVAEATPADLVLLTIGGNDLGFVEIVADCLGVAELAESPGGAAPAGGGWTSLVETGRLDEGCDVTGDELRERVAAVAAPDRFALPDGRTGDLAAVHAAVARATVADGGRMLVVGYPALFEDPERWADRYGQRCHGVRARDVTDLNAAVVELDDVLADAAARADEALGGGVVGYVGLRDAYDAGEDDHRLCGAGEDWMNGLTFVEGGVDVAQLLTQLGTGAGGLDLEAIGARPSGSFHPGTAGHAGTARTVLDHLDHLDR